MKIQNQLILATVILVAGTGILWKVWPQAADRFIKTEVPAEESTVEEFETAEVLLSSEKMKAIHLTVSPVKRQKLNQTRVVLGRLQYDDRKHVAVKAPTEGILVEVRVKPGDIVQAGQVLAVLNSREIGTARADLLQRIADYQLVRKQYDWKSAIQNNVQKLVDALLSHQAMDAVETQFTDTKLGSYRSQLLPAYTRYLLAETINKKTAPLAKSGAISQQTIQMREADVQETRAALKALCEQSIYDVKLERDQALADLNDADNRMTISRQHLESLVGCAVDINSAELKAAEKLSRLEIIAPFTGTIEERTFSQSERVNRADSLFTLAQTDTLWVAADIRESDWNSIELNTGQNLTVTVNAVPGRTFNARLHYLGRQVSANTNSVPLIAELKNPDGILRPGMYAQVRIPGKQQADVIAVPARSVLDDAAQEFVFVKESERSFRRIDIQSGLKTEDWVEVQKGLKGGEQVVEDGAFTLKSELLLEREE